MSQPAASESQTKSDFCLFERAGQRFGISTELVREILESRPFTTVPHAPDGLLGAVSLRGEIIPLVSLDDVVGVTGRAPDRRDSILVLQEADIRIAVIVDQVATVRHIAPWEIRRPEQDPLPSVARGSLSIDGARTIVLDGGRLLTTIADRIIGAFRRSTNPSIAPSAPTSTCGSEE